jgi:cell division protein FtsQ
VASRPRATARVAAAPAAARAPSFLRFIPSARSVLIGIALLAVCIGAYLGASRTSVFAVQTIKVTGGTPQTRAAVRDALAPELGVSLLRVGGGEINGRLAALPDVMSVHFDRAFPHTLKIRIKAERAALLLRQGSQAWVVSASGRVIRPISSPRKSALPRLWVPRAVAVTVGANLPGAQGGEAARALRPLLGTPMYGQVRAVTVGKDTLTLVRASGPELRLGDTTDLGLKLAISKRILAVLGPDTTERYLDVSVPERPVAGT